MFREIIIPLLFGLALFISGMKIMELALQAWAGPALTRLLNAFTATPVKGLLFSTFVSAALQSSTAVTVMTIGLVNAGLLSYARTLGIILGGNIGTCLTTELIALKVSGIGVPLLLASLAAWIAAVVLSDRLPARLKRFAPGLKSIQLASLALFGFSIVLVAISWMQTTGHALEEHGLISWFTAKADQSLMYGVLAGAVMAAAVHSSAAVIGLAMGLAASGALPVPIGIAVVIGSNIGTCVTAVIAAIGGTRAGRFVAWSHIALNAGGALLFFPLIPQLEALASLISSDASGQIAHSQTLFNLISSLLALPLCYLPIWKRLK